MAASLKWEIGSVIVLPRLALATHFAPAPDEVPCSAASGRDEARLRRIVSFASAANVVPEGAIRTPASSLPGKPDSERRGVNVTARSRASAPAGTVSANDVPSRAVARTTPPAAPTVRVRARPESGRARKRPRNCPRARRKRTPA